MPITIVTTSGDASANSYATSLEVDDYAQAAFDGSAWTSLATQPEKDVLLVRSTRLLDSIVTFAGRRSTATQRLAWPRTYVSRPSCGYYDSDEIPQALKDAQCELAIWLAAQATSGSDPFGTNDLAAFDSLVVGPISIDFVEGSVTNDGTKFMLSTVLPILRAGMLVSPAGRLTR